MDYKDNLIGLNETFDLIFNLLNKSTNETNIIKNLIANLNKRIELLESYHVDNPQLGEQEDDIEMKEPDKTNDKIVVGYCCEWDIYQRKYDLTSIPVDKMTHLIYSFMLPNVSKKDIEAMKLEYPPKPDHFNEPLFKLVAHDQYAFDKNMKSLKVLKEKNPNLKILVSIGGWTLSGWFSKIFSNSEWRRILILSIKETLLKYNFDGIDIDWEYPNHIGRGYNYHSKDDNLYFKMFLKELREELDDKYLITAAIGVGTDKINEFNGIDIFCDYIFAMTYDLSGSWDKYRSHQSPLYDSLLVKNKQYNVDTILKKCVNELKIPKHKLCMGIPFYYRNWGNSLSSKGDNEPGYTGYNNLIDYISENKTNEYYYYESDFSNTKTINKVKEFYDQYMNFRGDGQVEINDNIATLSGREPRMYFNMLKRDYQVSFDFYQNTDIGENWSGSTIGLRSSIDGHTSNPSEMAHTYYFRMRLDKTIDLYKELDHNNYNTRKVLINKKFDWDIKKWYNIKFKCYNKTPYIVKLEGFIDNKLVIEYEDNDKIFYEALGCVLIRNTNSNSSYKNIKIGPVIEEKNLMYHFDNVAKVPYYTSPDGDLFVGDNPISIEYKCKYIKDNGYAGCFYWCISDDYRNYEDNKSLIKTISTNLLI